MADEKPYEGELAVALEHQRALDEEMRALHEARAQGERRMAQVSALAQQALGRVETLRELRGELTPLAPPSDAEEAPGG